MKSILVVDDSSVSRELVKYALETAQYRVVEAKDGQDALKKLQDERPDLVLMDIQMPVLDGYSTLREIRKDPRFATLPVIAITAYAMLGDREKAFSAGFDGYVAKPINVTALRLQVEQFLH